MARAGRRSANRVAIAGEPAAGSAAGWILVDGFTGQRKCGYPGVDPRRPGRRASAPVAMVGGRL